jgi:hypothetical protein
MTPGLNLSRYERPLAERRLLGGALRDRWEPNSSHLVVLPALSYVVFLGVSRVAWVPAENDLCG